MGQVLKGEYEYVMTTHVDKNHIHNHFEIRGISDALCYKNRLSAIEHSSGINGISYKEVLERKEGTSWKAKLQYAIGNAIKKSKTGKNF